MIQRTVHFRKNGKDGTSDQMIFKLGTVYPCPYTAPTGGSGDTDVPSGWSRQMLGVSSSEKYLYASSRQKANGVWSAWSTPEIFTKWAADGTSISISGSAKGVITWNGQPPSNPSVGDIYLNNSTWSSASNQDPADAYIYRAVYTNAYAWIPVTAELGDGYLINGDFWQKVAEAPTSATDRRWENRGHLQGPPGEDGAPAPTATAAPAIISVPCDSSGYAIASGSYSIDLRLIVAGQNLTLTASSYTKPSGVYGVSVNLTTKKASVTVMRGTSTATFEGNIAITLTGTYDGKSYTAVAQIAIVGNKTGVPGERGLAGPSYYLAGEYPSGGAYYERDDTFAPIVLYKTGNTYEYWGLVEANNSDGNGGYTAPSDTQGNPWKKAENFSFLLTEALFTPFAKLGAFVINNDYFLSQYGTLFSAIGTEIGVASSRTVGKVYMRSINNGLVPYYAPDNNQNNDKPIYTYFRDSDPMAERSDVALWPKFRPMKAIDARTGREWMAAGNVLIETDEKGEASVTIRGTIMATNLFQNLCLFSGGSSGIVYSTITYYIKQKPTIGMGTEYDMDCATAAEVTVNTNFWNALQVNGYYTEQEIVNLLEQYTAGGITPDFIEHDDYATKYFWLKCTGLSNLIQMIPTVSGYGYDTNYPVKLPRAVDFPNKVIEITGWSRVVDERQMYIGCVDDKMRGGIDVSDGEFAFYGNPTARITIMTGAVYKFQSISLDGGQNYYWVNLGKNV